MALTLRFNLMELLLSAEESKAKQKALAPFVKKEAIKREFGNRAVDKILDRTLSGKDKNKSRFVGYAKATPKTGTVNLRETNAMQGAVHTIKTTASTVTIGITSDTQSRKARWHINGAGNLPVRDWWGLNQTDQLGILKGVIKDFNLREEARVLEELREEEEEDNG